MKDFRKIIADKPYFILTTNADKVDISPERLIIPADGEIVNLWLFLIATSIA